MIFKSRFIRHGFLSIVVIFALHGTALAQPEALKAAREAVTESIERLEEIKASTPADENRKDLEFELRRNALDKIIAFTVLETEELQSKLERLKDVEAPFIILQDAYIADLEQFLTDLKAAEDSLSQILTSDDVRKLAGAFAEWRAANYNPALRRITDFALAFQNRTLLKVADQRFVKVATDLKKSKINQESWQGTLNGAALRLREAREYNNRAVNALARFLPAEETSDLTLKADSAPGASPEEPGVEIKSLVEKSLGTMRSAYKNFLELNELLKRR